MSKNYRYFTLEQLGYTEEQIKLIVAHHMKLDPNKINWCDVKFLWSQSTETAQRYIFIDIDDIECMFEVQPSVLLTTWLDLQIAFGDDGAHRDTIIDRLALYDTRRTLKYILVNHYQKLIMDLNKF